VAPKLLADVDLSRVPLPNGTKVTARVELALADRRVPEGAVGQVVALDGEHVEVKLADGSTVRYLRRDVVPTKLGQQRYAVRRERAWQALVPCVVLETVVGSRAWGLADENSDVDRRGIFVLPFSWTTSLVEPPSDLVSAGGSDTYWEIAKALRQGLRADPNTLETFFVRSAHATDPLGERLLAARDALPSVAIYGSFGRYALSQLKRLQQSMRLATHRAELASWLRANATPTLDEAAAHLAEAAAVEGIDERDRRRRAKAYIKQLYASIYDRGLLEQRDFASFVAYARREDLDGELPRHLRPKNAYNLLRLIATATGWLATGQPELEVRGALRDRLLAIKHGEIPLETILGWAEAMMPALDHARANSRLPAHPDFGAVDQILREVRTEAARRHFADQPGPFGRDAALLPSPETPDA
jgi:RNA repair pathway DNA polymerase beta family